MKPIVTIQYLRAIAALMVVLFHASIVDGPDGRAPLFRIGEFGVDIFFVISGFIMWTLINHRPAGPGPFIARRILRIVPLYWAMTIIAATASTRGGFSIDLTPEAGPLIRSLFFIPYWNKTAGMLAPELVVGWTLNLEMAFYALFALCLFLKPARRLFAICSVLFGCTILGVLAPPEAPWALYADSIIAEFAFGVLIGEAWLKGAFAKRDQKSMTIAALLLLATAAAWLWAGPVDHPARLIAFGVPAALIVAGALMLEPAFARRPLRIGLFLGEASYAIYLSHTLAIALADALVLDLPPATWLAISILAFFAASAGACVHLLIEKPLTGAVRAFFARLNNSTRQSGPILSRLADSPVTAPRKPQ